MTTLPGKCCGTGQWELWLVILCQRMTPRWLGCGEKRRPWPSVRLGRRGRGEMARRKDGGWLVDTMHPHPPVFSVSADSKGLKIGRFCKCGFIGQKPPDGAE